MSPKTNQNKNEGTKALEELEAFVFPKMTREALERYGRASAVHPQIAVRALLHAGQLLKENKLTTIKDQDMKSLLMQQSQRKHNGNK